MHRNHPPHFCPALAWICLLGFAIPVLADDHGPPDVVSPRGSTAATCPTFSWAGVSNAEGYELAVYRVLPDGEVLDESALSAWLPSGATSWTPPADACLEAGARYGWSIRATGKKSAGEWSEPALIEFAVGPTVAEVQAAMATLDRFLIIQGADPLSQGIVRTRPEGRHPPPNTTDSPTYGDGSETAHEQATEPEAGLPVAHAETPRSLSKSITVQAAAMKVEGELRTVDESGDPRLWGKGRPDTEVYGSGSGLPCLNGNIKFGLSKTPVAWGSAANACPAGTWVCEANDLVACNTTRANFSVDGRTCAGDALDWAENNHIGWTAAGGSNTLTGTVFFEGGSTSAIWSTCNTMPVWCCWK